MIPRKDKDGTYHKGNIGIFSNIPDHDNDPDERYASETGLTADDIYPGLAENLKKIFKKYCGSLVSKIKTNKY